MPLRHALGGSTSGRLRPSGQNYINQYKNIGICALRTPERTSSRSALRMPDCHDCQAGTEEIEGLWVIPGEKEDGFNWIFMSVQSVRDWRKGGLERDGHSAQSAIDVIDKEYPIWKNPNLLAHHKCQAEGTPKNLSAFLRPVVSTTLVPVHR